jgi:hypothetical protein
MLKFLIPFCLALPAAAQTGVSNILIFNGNCTKESSLAEGPAASDLTNRKSQLYCDTAVITRFDNHRMLINFSLKGAHHSPMLAFAGTPDGDNMVNVDEVYFSPAEPTPVKDAGCKLFYEKSKLTGIACFVQVYEETMRTVSVITFDANP